MSQKFESKKRIATLVTFIYDAVRDPREELMLVERSTDREAHDVSAGRREIVGQQRQRVSEFLRKIKFGRRNRMATALDIV